MKQFFLMSAVIALGACSDDMNQAFRHVNNDLAAQNRAYQQAQYRPTYQYDTASVEDDPSVYSRSQSNICAGALPGKCTTQK